MAAVETYFSSVSLLLHFDGANGAATFTDSSGTPKSTSGNGAAQLTTAQFKWGTASVLLDGLGDSVVTAVVAATNLTTGDFTVELWVRAHVFVGDATLFMHSAAASPTSPVNGYPWRIHYDHVAQLFRFSGWLTGNAASFSIPSLVSPDVGRWYHLAGVRSGSTFYFFVDGELQGSVVLAGTLISAAGTIAIGGIGAINTGCDFFNGWIDDLRMTRGVARYTSSFAAPTTPFPNSNDMTGSIAAPVVLSLPALTAATLFSGSISSPSIFGDVAIHGWHRVPVEQYFQAVSLLLHFDGSDGSTTFTDSSSYAHTVTREIGSSAQIDTAQSKFGGASCYFDTGTPNYGYLKVPAHYALDLSSAEFTVELWVRLDSLAVDSYFFGGFNFQSQVQLAYIASSGKFVFNAYDSGGNNAGTITATGVTVATNTWYHLAATRQFRTFRFFVDGALIDSATFTNTLRSAPTHYWVGKAQNPSEPWIDELRITKGVARYTAAFTPQTEAHPNGNDMLGSLRAPAVFGDIAMTGGAAIGGHLQDGGLPAAPSVYGGIANRGQIVAPAVIGGTLSARLRGILIGGWLAAPSMFGAVYAKATHDFLDAVEGLPTNYNLDLVTPTGNVRVPMTSWAATLQVENQCYARCTVPGADAWLDALEEATSFIVYRSARLPSGGVIEAEIVTAPLDTLQIDRGPTNNTASLSGYFPAYEEDDDPDPQFDRVLTGIRSTSSYESGLRVRSDIDWTLRPAQRAFYGEASFIVSYMNLYATCYKEYADAYMDVGERI